MKEVTILGKNYPIEYTVEAQSKFAEKGGGLKRVSTVITNYPSFALSTMMVAAAHRKKVFAKMEGTEYDGPEPMSEDELNAILMPTDLLEILRDMTGVMSEAFKTDVETAPEKNTGKKKQKPPHPSNAELVSVRRHERGADQGGSPVLNAW